MEPVNKWLLTVISFMIAVLVVLAWKAGSGHYEMVVRDSVLFEGRTVVYVLDTKSGDVNAIITNENDLQYNGNPRHRPTNVYTQPTITGRRY
ncbi:MAG: hypothetical protein AMJ56_07640 [Anaerolineae bacterium SG8_19]|nr:MAG: hypothetical protein AMJ56_07640 [Anaerolineae bacterium SG8_19]